MLSGEGSQRSSPRSAAARRSTGRFYQRGPPSDVAVEGPHQLEREAVGTVEGRRVDPVGRVVRGVAAGDVAELVADR